MAISTPKIQIRLLGKQLEARNYLQDVCGLDINLLIRRFLVETYESEKAKRATQ